MAVTCEAVMWQSCAMVWQYNGVAVQWYGRAMVWHAMVWQVNSVVVQWWCGSSGGWHWCGIYVEAVWWQYCGGGGSVA